MQFRIKELRKTLGYTQGEFAQKLEVATSCVSAWECGRQEVPPSRVYQICQTFHVRRSWLESGVGEIFGPSSPRLTKVDASIEVGVNIVKSLPDNEKRIIVKLAEHILLSLNGD